jgi:hypothetical protein
MRWARRRSVARACSTAPAAVRARARLRGAQRIKSRDSEIENCSRSPADSSEFLSGLRDVVLLGVCDSAVGGDLLQNGGKHRTVDALDVFDVQILLELTKRTLLGITENPVHQGLNKGPVIPRARRLVSDRII